MGYSHGRKWTEEEIIEEIDKRRSEALLEMAQGRVFDNEDQDEEQE